jgi:hypothetical protein
LSDYWKKKLDELEKKDSKPSTSSSSDYWQKKMSDLEESEKKKKKREEDIAPTITPREDITTKKSDERKWFQKGEFEDGYQFGDISKTILGTKFDVTENLTAGVLGMGEKVVDAAAYIAPVADHAFRAMSSPFYFLNLEKNKK